MHGAPVVVHLVPSRLLKLGVRHAVLFTLTDRLNLEEELHCSIAALRGEINGRVALADGRVVPGFGDVPLHGRFELIAGVIEVEGYRGILGYAVG